VRARGVGSFVKTASHKSDSRRTNTRCNTQHKSTIGGNAPFAKAASQCAGTPCTSMSAPSYPPVSAASAPSIQARPVPNSRTIFVAAAIEDRQRFAQRTGERRGAGITRTVRAVCTRHSGQSSTTGAIFRKRSVFVFLPFPLLNLGETGRVYESLPTHLQAVTSPLDSLQIGLVNSHKSDFNHPRPAKHQP
jgi:hypothetical protein